MNNMDIYNRFREVPAEAQRKIEAGRLKGFTDINPMWRIKMLTEEFGPCGFGWYTDHEEFRTEKGEDGRVAMFCQLKLYVKVNGEWSEGIRGIGGSMFTDIEKGGPRTSDEAMKMAYTDALSVACKALGMAANIYYAKDRTKYTAPAAEAKPESKPEPKKEEDYQFRCSECGEVIKPYITDDGKVIGVRRIAESSKAKYGRTLCTECAVKAKAVEDIKRMDS